MNRILALLLVTALLLSCVAVAYGVVKKKTNFNDIKPINPNKVERRDSCDITLLRPPLKPGTIIHTRIYYGIGALDKDDKNGKVTEIFAVGRAYEQTQIVIKDPRLLHRKGFKVIFCERNWYGAFNAQAILEQLNSVKDLASNTRYFRAGQWAVWLPY